MSIPFVVYGSGSSFFPLIDVRGGSFDGGYESTYFLATCSMLYPGLGSLLKLITRANLSKQFPTAMSRVSPKMRYRC